MLFPSLIEIEAVFLIIAQFAAVFILIAEIFSRFPQVKAPETHFNHFKIIFSVLVNLGLVP